MSKNGGKGIESKIAAALESELQGQIEQSAQLADEAWVAAKEAGDRALQIQALVQKARALDSRQTASARGESERLYSEALVIAKDEGDAVQIEVIWHRRALSAIRMDPDTTQALQHCEAHRKAVDELADGVLERARNQHLRSEIAYRRGSYVDTENEARAAIALVDSMSPQKQPVPPVRQLDRCRYQVALAKSLLAQGKIEQALEEYEKVQALVRGGLKLSCADMVTLRMNHGLALMKQGLALMQEDKAPAAKTALSAARTMLSDVLNNTPDELRLTLDTGIIHTFLSDLSYSEPGMVDDAAFHAHEALKIYNAIGAPDHRKAEAWTNIANVAMKRKEFGAARDSYQHALDLRQSKLADNHYQLGVNIGSLAEAFVGLERYEDAKPHADQARRILAGSGQNQVTLQWINDVNARALAGLKRDPSPGAP